jgi:glycosyltransferase involved in cell wall biosynthesis
VFVESDTPLPAHSPLWKRFLKRAFYPLMFRIPRRLLPGGSLQRDYLKHYGVPDDRISIAQMTVDVAGILKRCAELSIVGSRIRYRSRFGMVDGNTVFMASFAQLSASRADVNLLIAGDGSMRPVVEAAAASNPALNYLGRLEGQEVIEAMDSADVAVLPSTFEPWGLVVNEAMAAGLTVIASDRVGCRIDLVRHNQTGVVVPAGSVTALHDAMAQLAANPGERKRMAGEARATISTWTLENWARNITHAWQLRTKNENSRH